MDVAIYRKLTRKSQLKFGKYADFTVGDLLAQGWRRAEYLSWAYFNMSKITFFDDILDELEIPEEFRISKPGKDEAKFEEWRSWKNKKHYDEIYGGMSDEEVKKVRGERLRRLKKAHKAHLIAEAEADRIKNRQTKGALQWKNQGHKVGEK